MSSGAYGLLGVLVGAVISSGLQLWLHHRQEAADRARREKERAARLRQAARLVADDLFAIQGWLGLVHRESDTRYRRWRADSLNSWIDYRAILAAEMEDFTSWNLVRWAVFTTRAAMEEVDRHSPGAPLSENTSGVIEVALKDIRQASTALEPFVGR
jgi:hypothetical protein